MITNKIYQNVSNGYRRNMILLLVLALEGIGCLSALPAKSDGVYSSVKPGDISMKLTIIPSSGTITAEEPLLAQVETRNNSGGNVELQSSSGGTPNSYVEIRDDKDVVVASTKHPSFPEEEGVQGIIKLAPGENRTKIWVISALYQFKKSGRYTVHIQQIEEAEGLPVIAEDSASVQVLPFNASRLDARCNELMKPIRTESSGKTDLPADVRMKALYSIHNNKVLPHLEWAARELGSQNASIAMLRLGTDEAKSIVKALATRTDKVGVAARQAMEEDSTTRDLAWDMNMY